MNRVSTTAVLVTLFGTIYLIGRWTDGNASLMLFGLAAWAALILAVSWFLSRLFSYQRRIERRLRMNRVGYLKASRPRYADTHGPATLPYGSPVVSPGQIIWQETTDRGTSGPISSRGDTTGGGSQSVDGGTPMLYSPAPTSPSPTKSGSSNRGLPGAAGE